MTETAAYLAFARELADIGSRVALGHYRRDPQTKRKSDGTWVTEADWKAEAQIRVRIARTYPEHNILGEEEGLTAAGGGPAVDGAPTWVIDPIDETHNYIAGIPIWATLVALRIDGRNVVGAAHAPALEERYDGGLELGARLNDDTISVAPSDDLSKATVLFADASSFRVAGLDEFFDRLVHRAWRTRGFGGFWGHLLVARGAAHVMVEPQLRDWDVAALEPIITEAGGRVSQIDGSAFADGGSCLTTCGNLHDEVVRLGRGTPDRGD